MDDLLDSRPKRPCSKAKQDQGESKEVKLNDLPDLPFELILSQLSLEDRIQVRRVSKKWKITIESLGVKNLCYSEDTIGFIYPKSHWVNGAFARNLISSPKFDLFFQTFGHSILSNLKHLRLCELLLDTEHASAFAKILNSFDQLEELGLFRVRCLFPRKTDLQMRLNLPMLKSIHLEQMDDVSELILDMPRLQKAKLVICSFESRFSFVHGESLEKLTIDNIDIEEVSKLRNLKYLYLHSKFYASINSTLLSALVHLKELHLNDHRFVSNLFEQKQRYGRSNLKIFLCGCLLNAPSVPTIDSPAYENRQTLRYLIENKSRLADEILFRELYYSEVDNIAPGLEIDLSKRFINLECITVLESVQDVDRFLELLKNLNNIVELEFYDTDQPQQLFDRLPDHCDIQKLDIEKAPADLNFLIKLKSLINLNLRFEIHIEIVRKVLEEMPFLSNFEFHYLGGPCRIIIDHLANNSKGFTAWFVTGKAMGSSDVDSVVQWFQEQKTK